ncbi:MAG: glycoside hydrolase family 18 protein [Gammaproteobacteria bacterium]|nr:glycoside hydrolase family 18 protein [Gammaproteobacteria bacterium]
MSHFKAKRVRTFLLPCFALLLLPGFSFAANNIAPPKNVIGFFQSYDSEETWLFNGENESLASSGYTILVDAFWTNYPFCWGDGRGTPGLGSPIPSCLGVINAPGPGTSYSLYDAFWLDYQGAAAPRDAGEAYNNYWTSFHTSGPGVISKLRTNIEKTAENTLNHQKIKLLAGIGGWNMGGSSADNPVMPMPPEVPAWAALLSNPSAFANAMNDIVNLKVNGVTLYDGIDIDIETLYGEGCENETCTIADKDKALDNLVSALIIFKKLAPNAILSTSPRASDIACLKQYCYWNSNEGLGFMGEALQQLAKSNVYFDHINPQFYNDDGRRNIPNGQRNGPISYGEQVPEILAKLKETGAIGVNTSINIGVLNQTNNYQTDTGGADSLNNPGVAKESINELWTLLKTDSALINSGVEIDGLMTWSVNLALNGSGIGGNVRSLTSPKNDVPPYNWPASLFESNGKH